MYRTFFTLWFVYVFSHEQNTNRAKKIIRTEIADTDTYAHIDTVGSPKEFYTEKIKQKCEKQKQISECECE